MWLKRVLGPPLGIEWEIAVVTVSSTLLLIVDAYHRLTPVKGLDRTILYLLVPMLIVLVVFRQAPGNFGFQVGDWKAGLILVAVGIVLSAPLLWLSARGGAMRDYYQQQILGLPWKTLLDLLGWEFFFRGFILFTYARKLGAHAIWLQAVPFALAHIGKPEIETLSTIFGGFVFGWIAYRTRSFVYPLLLHWFIATFTILAAAGFLG
jgi:CAAX protease family protein